jgi:predicted acyltransferase
MLIGAGLLIIAYFWNPIFPVNKKLWTSSFAILTVGLDCFILSIIIYLTDIKMFRKGTGFFITVGKNPLVVYLVSELGVTVMLLVHIGNETLYKWLYNRIFVFAGDYFGAFLFSVWWMLMCWLVGYFLDKKKVYIRL